MAAALAAAVAAVATVADASESKHKKQQREGDLSSLCLFSERIVRRKAYSLFPKNEMRFSGNIFLSSSVILS